MFFCVHLMLYVWYLMTSLTTVFIITWVNNQICMKILLAINLNTYMTNYIVHKYAV